jgi:GcrA cell cycle regulator
MPYQPDSVAWTSDEDAIIRSAAQGGLSAAQASAKLAGRTRSAVIGRAHRLKIAFGGGTRKPPKRSAPPKERAAVAKPAAEPIAKKGKAKLIGGALVLNARSLAHPNDYQLRAQQRADAPGIEKYENRMAAQSPVAPVFRLLELVQLEISICKWPVSGTGTEARFCGAATDDPLAPYCVYHARIAYQPAATRSARR